MLKSGARVLLEAPPAGSLEERFYQIYGDRPDLVPVAKQAAGITVAGFVAALGEQGPARGPQHVFVNQRIVRDRTIAHAIQQAYSVATIKERSPEVHLFIELAGRSRGRERASDEGRGAVSRSGTGARGAAPRDRRCARRDGGAGAGPVAGARRRRPSRSRRRCRWDSASAAAGSAGGAAGDAARGRGRARAARSRPRRRPVARSARPDDARAARPIASLIRPMTPLGQFRNTFIIAVDDEGLAIIDQHVAHERILFEQISERLTTRRARVAAAADAGRARGQSGRASDAAVARDGARRGSASRSRTSAARSLRIGAVPALLDWKRVRGGAARRRRRSRRPRARRRRRRRAAADGRDDGVSCGGEGERPAHAREDAVSARRAAAHVAFVGLSARPAGRAAADAAGDRAELRAGVRAMRISVLALLVLALTAPQAPGLVESLSEYVTLFAGPGAVDCGQASNFVRDRRSSVSSSSTAALQPRSVPSRSWRTALVGNHGIDRQRERRRLPLQDDGGVFRRQLPGEVLTRALSESGRGPRSDQLLRRGESRGCASEARGVTRSLVAGSRAVDCGRLGIRATEADLRRSLDCALEASRRR